MGWLDSLIGGVTGVITNERQISANKQSQEDAQAHAAAMQEDAQEFNFAMQQDAQRYNSSEAEKAYNREVEFYEKYSSPKAQIASMMEAGVNPFSITGAGSGPMARSSAASSGAASSGVGSVGAVGVGSLTDPLASIVALAQAKLLGAQANKVEQETPFSVEKLLSEITVLDQQAQLNAAQSNKVIEETKNIIQNRENLVAQLNLTYDQAENLQASTQKLISEFERIDALKDYEKRSYEARATVDEYEASVASLVEDLTSGGKYEAKDFVGAMTKIFFKLLGIKN